MKWTDWLFCMMFLSLFFDCSQVLSCGNETIIVIHTWFTQHTDLMGFMCVISITSPCVLNNLDVDTVGYLLRGLLSPGGCSCAGFPFYGFLFFSSSYLCKITVCSSHVKSGALPLCSISVRYISQCCGHHPFVTGFQSNWSESSWKSLDSTEKELAN